MNKDSYTAAMDRIRFSENLDQKVLDYLKSQQRETSGSAGIREEGPVRSIRKKGDRKMMKTIGALGAAAVVACASFFALPQIGGGAGDFDLPNSTGKVAVSYAEKVPEEYLRGAAGLLQEYSEQELLFQKSTDAFKGVITELKNIEIRTGGQSWYQAIAKVKVDQVYRGQAKSGETISILLPAAIPGGEGTSETKGTAGAAVLTEDQETINAMEVGMTGIFLPLRYDDSAVLESEGAVLHLKDLAEYGLSDGVRFAFLDTENGLEFARFAYQPIAEASALDQVESYLTEMFRQKG